MDMTPPASPKNQEQPSIRPPGCRPYQPCNKNRVCAYTLVKEKNLPEGQKLFACGKCLETFYIDRESQKKDWVETHKFVCCALKNDRLEVRQGFDSIDKCFDTLESILAGFDNEKTFPKGRLFLHALKEIKAYSIEVVVANLHDDEITHHFRDRIYKVIAGFSFNCHLPPEWAAFYTFMWSLPGFANAFLSNEIFLSPTMKQYKEEGLPPLAKYDMVETDDGSYHYNATPERLMKELNVHYALWIAAVYAQSVKYASAGGKTWRLAALLRNGFECWTCPYTRSSFPAYSGIPFGCISLNRSEFFHSLLLSAGLFGEEWSPSGLGPWLRKGEILPGMTLKALFAVTMEDEAYFLIRYCAKKALCECFTNLVDHIERCDKLSKQQLSAGDRWELLKTWSTWTPVGPNMLIFMNGSLEAIYVRFIIGCRADNLFDLYDLANDEFALQSWKDDDVQRRNNALLALIKGIRSGALESSKPLAAAYVEVIEPLYEEQMIRSGLDIMPFPEDAEDLISEFAADKFFFRT